MLFLIILFRLTFRKELIISLLLMPGFSLVAYSASKPILCPQDAHGQYKKSSAKYAYCGPATCTRDGSGEYALCKGCLKLIGPNIGTVPCAKRAPKGDTYFSSWSMRTNIGPTAMPVVVCDPKQGADIEYANCLNAPCNTDDDTGTLTCKCLIEKNPNKRKWVGQVLNCDASKLRSHACHSQGGRKILNGAPYGFVAPLMKVVESHNPNAVCE